LSAVCPERELITDFLLDCALLGELLGVLVVVLFPVVIPNGIAQSRASIATFILRCLACSAACLPAALCTIQFWRRTRSTRKGFPGLARAPFLLADSSRRPRGSNQREQPAVLIFSLTLEQVRPARENY
jgi:hypothetical protein